MRSHCTHMYWNRVAWYVWLTRGLYHILFFKSFNSQYEGKITLCPQVYSIRSSPSLSWVPAVAMVLDSDGHLQTPPMVPAVEELPVSPHQAVNGPSSPARAAEVDWTPWHWSWSDGPPSMTPTYCVSIPARHQSMSKVMSNRSSVVSSKHLLKVTVVRWEYILYWSILGKEHL